jgi:hypothetical protein
MKKKIRKYSIMALWVILIGPFMIIHILADYADSLARKLPSPYED